MYSYKFDLKVFKFKSGNHLLEKSIFIMISNVINEENKINNITHLKNKTSEINFDEAVSVIEN